MSSVAQPKASGKPSEPKKPRPDFLLFPHATRRWAKKIKGKLHDFGSRDDPDAPLERHLDTKDDLYAGRKPRASNGRLVLQELVNRFLTVKQDTVNTGEIQLRTFNELYATCRIMLSVFGKTRRLDDLGADDFEVLRRAFARGRGLEAPGNQIRRARSVFKYAYDVRAIERPCSVRPRLQAGESSIASASEGRETETALNLRFHGGSPASSEERRRI